MSQCLLRAVSVKHLSLEAVKRKFMPHLGSIPYYYFYKRTALMLGDRRFYTDSTWLRIEMERKR